MIQQPQNTLPILYSFRRCPYAMRARIALKYSGIAVHLREIVLRNKPQAMLSCSTKGTVPILLLPNGEVIDESRDIISWALTCNDPDQWQPKKDSDQYKLTESLLGTNDSEFKIYLDQYKYPDRHPEHSVISYRTQGEQFLTLLEAQLHSHHYLISDTVSIADIGIFPFIRQFAHVDRDWFYQAPYPKLQAWLDSFLQSELFDSVMNKYIPWSEASEPIIFG